MGWTDVTGEVVSQYVYSPYGQPLLAERLSPYAPSHVPGHQGLVFVALGDVSSGAGVAPWQIGEADLSPAAVGFYYNRNRILLPHLGRFAQRDMNETALMVLTLAMNAQALDLLVEKFNATSHYGDGMNLFLYLGANPIGRDDPLGLSWWDDDIDDAIADFAGNALYTLGALADQAKGASLNLSAAMSIAASILGLDAIHSAYLLATGQGTFWDGLNVVMSLNPVGRGLKVAAAIGKAVKFGKAARGAVACTGQWHHAIPRKVHRALEDHPRLKGKYKYRDNRFKTQGKDPDSHKGYQKWHRNLDDEIAKMIDDSPQWTEAEFEAYLRSVYERSDLLKLFPNGL